MASLKILLRHGSNPLAECQGGFCLPLHIASAACIAKAMIGNAYWKRLASETFDPRAAFTMLCKKNECAKTSLGVAKHVCITIPEQDAAAHQSLRNRSVLVAYLEGWVSSKLLFQGRMNDAPLT